MWEVGCWSKYTHTHTALASGLSSRVVLCTTVSLGVQPERGCPEYCRRLHMLCKQPLPFAAGVILGGNSKVEQKLLHAAVTAQNGLDREGPAMLSVPHLRGCHSDIRMEGGGGLWNVTSGGEGPQKRHRFIVGKVKVFISN